MNLSPLPIAIKLLHPDAVVPASAHPDDAGYDLCAIEDVSLYPGSRSLVKTGLAMAIPPGLYGRVAGRSGLALRQGLHVLGGVIDSAYRGEIGVVLINLGDRICMIEAGQRVAQLVIERCYYPRFLVVDELDETGRSSGGFGSTGT